MQNSTVTALTITSVRYLFKKNLFRNPTRKVKALAVKCIVKASRERSELHRLTRSVEREGRRREKVRKERGADGFRPCKGLTNRVANEYLVWIRREPIAVRDVLPRSREKRQSGVLAVGVTLGKKNGEG